MVGAEVSSLTAGSPSALLPSRARGRLDARARARRARWTPRRRRRRWARVSAAKGGSRPREAIDAAADRAPGPGFRRALRWAEGDDPGYDPGSTPGSTPHFDQAPSGNTPTRPAEPDLIASVDEEVRAAPRGAKARRAAREAAREEAKAARERRAAEAAERAFARARAEMDAATLLAVAREGHARARERYQRDRSAVIAAQMCVRRWALRTETEPTRGETPRVCVCGARRGARPRTRRRGGERGDGDSSRCAWAPRARRLLSGEGRRDQRADGRQARGWCACGARGRRRLAWRLSAPRPRRRRRARGQGGISRGDVHSVSGEGYDGSG